MRPIKMERAFSTRYLLAALLCVKVIGVAFATLIFGSFTPLVDGELYINGSYIGEQFFRTVLVQSLATMANRLGGSYFAHLTFALISVGGLAYYYLTGGRRWVMILILLFPSALVWTSIVGKEALFFGGFTLLLVVWTRFATNELTRLDFGAAVVAGAMCALLRPHYAVVVIWLFASVAIVKMRCYVTWPLLLMIFLIGAFGLYITVWDELLYRGFGGIEPTARASRFNYFGIEARSDEGFEQFKSMVPLGALLGIVGPMPVELFARPEFIPFFMEGVLILLCPCFVYFYARKQHFLGRERFDAIFLGCLLPSILALMVLHAPFGLLNPGSATRWRVNFEAIFCMAPLLLLYAFMDNAPHENRSFPS